MIQKIAIIEDDLAISQMYRMKFEAEGYDVETAENGKVGIEMILTFKPDMILLDLMMPEMNGDEMLRLLRKDDWGKTAKVIILTNMGQEEAPKELREQLGVLSYVVKAEMTPKQVAEHVKEALST
jgi:DNA-binding response OmpR family regulator